MTSEPTSELPDRSDETGEVAADRCCEPAPAVDEGRLAEDVAVLSAMGNDTRYELLCRISAAGKGVCVCELEAAVGVSQSAVSQALSRLYAAGLVSRRKEGSWRYYGTTETAQALLEALDAVRGRGDSDD